MFIHRNTKRVKDKVYHSTLLMKSYRQKGKVKQKTISNLSSWPEELIKEFELLLKGDKVTKLEDLNHKQGKSYGAIKVIYEVAERLGILRALGANKNAALCMLLIMGRILTNRSRLYLCSWALDEAVEDILGIAKFDEDDLYEALDWLSENQTKIEKKLYKSGPARRVEELFLYDVTSSYLEGTENELSAYGYNRDGKKSKKQIVIGLLTDKTGTPVSVEVFKGNTQDPKTVMSQIKKLSGDFGVEKIVFVGDRGMLKSEQLKNISKRNWQYITAITKVQIEKLIKEDKIQLELFEEKLCEVDIESFDFRVDDFTEPETQIPDYIKTLTEDSGVDTPSFKSLKQTVAWLNKSIVPYQIFIEYMSEDELDEQGKNLINKIKKEYTSPLKEFTNSQLADLTKTDIGKQFKRLLLIKRYPLKTPKSHNIRYILRKNPERMKEIEKTRNSKIKYITEKIEAKNNYLSEHPRASVECAVKDINKLIGRLKLTGILELASQYREITYNINKENLEEKSRLDGCYAIKTNVPADQLKKEIVHDRYKGLGEVEKAFRTMKTGLLEVRPIFLRKESRTRGHVFICMLSYMITKYIWDNVKELNLQQEFIYQTLDRIQYITYTFENEIIKVLPEDYSEIQNQILSRLKIKLPHKL